jgi:hypothetical protein
MIFPRNNPNSLILFPAEVKTANPGISFGRNPNPELQEAVEAEQVNRIIARSPVISISVK